MKILIQNSKVMPVTENMTMPEETLTKKSLEEMYGGNMQLAGKINKWSGILGIGMLCFFGGIPLIIMLSTGMPLSDMLPIFLCILGFGGLMFLISRLSRKHMQSQYQAIQDGRFRLLSDTVVQKRQESHRDSDSHITIHTYYITGAKHSDYQRMFAGWWNMVNEGDPVYILEIANKRGKFHQCEVFPAAYFKLDQEMQRYVDRDTVNVGGFEG